MRKVCAATDKFKSLLKAHAACGDERGVLTERMTRNDIGMQSFCSSKKVTGNRMGKDRGLGGASVAERAISLLQGGHHVPAKRLRCLHEGPPSRIIAPRSGGSVGDATLSREGEGKFFHDSIIATPSGGSRFNSVLRVRVVAASVT